MKTGKKWCAGICAGILTATTILSPVEVYAQKNEEQKSTERQYGTSWEEVSVLLDKHLGVYEEPSTFDPKTKHTPDGPLMGNGTVLAYLSGTTARDAKDQTIYISRLDNFEELNENSRDIQYVGYGGIDIKRTDSNESVEDFRMEQDMKLAQVKGISESGFQTDTWLSAKENIIVSEITNLTDRSMDLDISVWTNVTDKVDQGISSVDSGVDEDNNLIYASRKTGSDIYDWSVNSTTALKLLNKEAAMEKVDDHTSKFSVSLDANESIYMIAAVEGGKESETDHEDALKKVLEFDSEAKIENAQTAHREWWKDYWVQSYMDLDEESDSIERLYYGQMYQIGCALQAMSENPAIGVTAGLFPWTGSSAPNWQGDYTLNSDVQRAIGVAVTANRLNHIDNYTQVIEDFWDTGVANASNPEHLNWLITGSDRTQFTEGIRGALFPTHIGPWGSRTEHFNAPNDYFCSPANGTMVLQPLIQYYKSTLDEGYLTERLYPMVREQADFWVDYAEKDDVTGKYNIYGATYESTTAYKNATLDLASAEFMLKNAIEFSEHLGVDADMRTQWKEVHDNLAEYPTKNGYYIEDERGADPTTTSCFNVYGFAFYDLVGPSSSQEEKDKILTWLETKQEFGTSDKQTRAAMTSARVGFDPDIWLDKMKAGYVDRTPDDWMGIRRNNTIGDIGGSLFSGAIMESLLQSHEGFINFFPAWYDDQEALFKNQRAYGAFTVSGYQNEWGQVESAAIHSEKGTECSVLNPWQEDGLEMKVYKNGKEVETTIEENSLGNVYTFKTEADADYELKPADELPAVIDIQNSEEDLFLEDTLQLMVRTNSDAEVVWSTSDQNVATVKNGIVEPKKIGDVTITAALKGNEAVTDSCTVHVVSDKKIAPEQLSAAADSEENVGGDGPAGNAVDGDESTIWHSGYSDGKVKPDIPNNINNAITIDLGESCTVGRLEYVPRSGSSNGDILKYELWYSTETEGDNFVKLTEGTWDESKNTKTAEFDPCECRRLRLRAMETAGENQFISAAEFYVYKTLPAAGDIAEVETDIPEITIPSGTAWEELLTLLPGTVEVSLSNGMKAVLSVEWDPDTYTGESGVVTGDLVGTDIISNPDNIQVQAVVKIEKIDRSTLEELYDQYASMEQGMYSNDTWGSLQKELEYTKSILDNENSSAAEMLDAKYRLEKAIAALKEIEGVEFEEENATVYIGIPKQLKVKNNTDGTLVWSSSDEEVLTVDEKGVVTPITAGMATISVNAEGTEYTDICKVTVRRNEHNHNLDNPAFTSSGYHDGFVPGNVADGRTGGTESESAAYAWVSPNVPITEPRWIAVEFPEPVTINKWCVTHVDKDGDGGSITRDFELQISKDGENWETVDTVKDNTELVNEKTFAGNGEVTSRFFRLYITAADNYNGQWPNNMARIDEWELVYEYGNYYVEFLPGGGSGEMDRQEFIYNEEKALQKNVFTKEGYIFDCWMDENGNRYEDGQIVSNLTPVKNEIIQLTAQWKEKEYIDKTDLKQAIEQGEAVDLTGYVEAGQAEFKAALDKAKVVLADENATQKDVDDARKALKEAIADLKLKADKSTLDQLIKEANEIDRNLYTEDSVAEFEEALKSAVGVLEDEALSADEQAEVEKAVKGLQDAIDALVLKQDNGGTDGNGDGNDFGDSGGNGSGNSNVGDQNGNKGSNSTDDIQKTVQTGDTTTIKLPIMGASASLLVIIAAGIIRARKKRK